MQCIGHWLYLIFGNGQPALTGPAELNNKCLIEICWNYSPILVTGRVREADEKQIKRQGIVTKDDFVL